RLTIPWTCLGSLPSVVSVRSAFLPMMSANERSPSSLVTRTWNWNSSESPSCPSNLATYVAAESPSMANVNVVAAPMAGRGVGPPAGKMEQEGAAEGSLFVRATSTPPRVPHVGAPHQINHHLGHVGRVIREPLDVLCQKQHPNRSVHHPRVALHRVGEDL